ncbi:hypothetical protein FOE78_01355 [Microlunatus elymi]|uniref:Immunity protein 50 n=1 Tax=Microlunatus elymi TaxID=2596828 RepID=A0A516PUC2_9ACTN|nr:hypothetical protein [Microlunatus elymi]QDP94742.1 hypothetical protein FOE78_01355 [Microlunatus elymi]
MADYWDLPGLAEVYFEDSWVLDVIAQPGRVGLDMDIVLRESHPDYRPPAPGEQYCYRRGRLIFAQVRSLSWQDQGAPPATDASGDHDYGSIDEFEVEEGNFTLTGDFGTVRLTSAAPQIVWAPTAGS